MLTVIAVFWLDGQRPPSKSVASVFVATRFGWWWTSVMMVLVGVLLAFFILFASERVPLEKTMAFRLLLKGPRQFRVAFAWLVWITVAVFVLGLAIGLFLI
jgi:hypothetical protein